MLGSGILSSLLQAITIAIFAALPGQMPEEHPIGAPSNRPGYSCGPSRWVQEPARIGDHYAGKMEAQCTVHPSQGGDFRKLEAFMLEELKRNGNILTGPVLESFEGLPSTFLTYRIDLRNEKVSVTLWQDIHIATDGTSRLVSATESTRIEGTGDSKFLKKAHAHVRITRPADASATGGDIALVSFYAELEKPWYAPEGIFLSKLREIVPSQFQEVRDQVMLQASQNY